MAGGYREDNSDNAIANANTPVIDGLMASEANTLISASGMDVGLPDGQMGNSEVGHTNIGAGRVVYQDLTRITKSITDGDFFENEALVSAMDKAINAGKAVHIMGLMSPGGVHSMKITSRQRLKWQPSAAQKNLPALLPRRP